jgi:hypothetical protein
MRRRIDIGDQGCRCRGPASVRSFARAGCVAVALLTSGCVVTGPLEWVENGFKVGPNYGRPPAPVADGWIEANDPKVQSRQLQDWWTVFNDPALNSLVETAFEENLTLRAAGTRILQARAQQAIAAGNIFPQTQQATGQYSRVGVSHTTANNPAFLSDFIPASSLAAIPPNAQPKN